MLTKNQYDEMIEVMSNLDFNMFEDFIESIGKSYVYERRDVREITKDLIEMVYEKNLTSTSTARVHVFKPNADSDEIQVILSVDWTNTYD